MTMKNPHNRAAALASRRRQQARHDALAGPRIAALITQGFALREICRALDDAQVPPPREGSQWHPETVKRIAARWTRAQTQAPRPRSLAWLRNLGQRLRWWR